jgi:hypothetical protein
MAILQGPRMKTQDMVLHRKRTLTLPGGILLLVSIVIRCEDMNFVTLRRNVCWLSDLFKYI